MSGTRSGGEQAAETCKERYGSDFYSKIGKLGGMADTPGVKRRGFGSDRTLAREAGSVGGKKSSRLGVKNAKNKVSFGKEATTSQDNAKETQEQAQG